MRLLALLACLPLLAQDPTAHPRILLTPAKLAALKAKVAANTLEWRQLKGDSYFSGLNCDRLVQDYSQYTPDGLPPVGAPGDTRASWDALNLTVNSSAAPVNLALCYHMVKDTNPTLAARYLAMTKKFLNAVADPFVTVTIDGKVRAVNYLRNTGPGGQALVYQPFTGKLENVTYVPEYEHIVPGKTVVISGSRGCPDANGTRVVDSDNFTQSQFMLNYENGDPVICPSSDLDVSWGWLRDVGYDIRVAVPQSVIAYDWIYNEISTDEDLKTRLYAVWNAFVDEFREVMVYTHPQEYATQGNYHAHYYAAIGLLGIATRGPGENPRGQEMYEEWRNNVHFGRDQPYKQRWLGNGGGYHETYHYMRDSAPAIIWTVMAQKTANNEDLVNGVDYNGQPIPAYPWPIDLMKYFLHTLTSDQEHFIDWGFQEQPTGNPYDVQRLMFHPTFMAWAAGDFFGHPDAPKFHKFVKDFYPVYHAKTGAPIINVDASGGALWERFMFWDPDVPESDWETTEPLSAALGSNPDGGWMLTTMRSSWDTTGVVGSFMVSPVTSDSNNGKERYDKGSIRIQRADRRLLVSALGEANHNYYTNGGVALHSYMNGTAISPLLSGGWYTTYGTWRPSQVADGHPGYNKGTTLGYKLTNFPTRINRYEEGGSYTYSKGVDLELAYRGDNTLGFFKMMQRWDRELLYIRPDLWVVYDRTDKVNKTTAPTRTYGNMMQWIVGKTPTVSGTTIKRIDVQDGALWKGTIRTVLPENSTVDIIDTGGFGAVFQVQVVPADSTANSIKWLHVIDSSTSSGAVATVTKLTSTNADAVQMSTGDVAVFVRDDVPTLPVTYTFSNAGDTNHYIVGLLPSTNYSVTVVGNEVTIAAPGETWLTSTANGILTFDGTGTGASIAINTTSLPGGQVGTVYSQTLQASGGSAPYTWSVIEGSLPAGLTLSSAGVVSGTPTTVQAASFTVQACDASLTCATQPLSIAVNPLPISITTAAISGGVVGAAYSVTLEASGGILPYTWSLYSGTLCTGLSLSSGGVISGTPTVAGSCTFTARVVDAGATADTQEYTLEFVGPVESNATVISVQPGSTSAVVTYGSPGLGMTVACTVLCTNTETGGSPGQASDSGGAATRTITVENLDPETSYLASVSCGGGDSPSLIFTTQAESVATAGVVVSLKPPGSLGEVIGKLKVEYGPAFASSVTDDTADGSGRYSVTIPAQTVGSIVQYRWQWLTAADVAVTGVSKTRFAVVK